MWFVDTNELKQDIQPLQATCDKPDQREEN